MRSRDARCIHAQHKKSIVPYHIEGGKFTVGVPILLGYNSIHHRYEHCDEGFMPAHRLPKLKKVSQED